jgi:hypothetical protein
MIQSKREIAGDIRRHIQVYAEITAVELLEQKIDPRSDKTWNEIVELLNKLIGEGNE